MANYKLEVRKLYGTFRAHFYDDAQGAADETEHSTIEDVVASVKSAAMKLDFDADIVIFRGTAYTSSEALQRQVKNAIY